MGFSEIAGLAKHHAEVGFDKIIGVLRSRTAPPRASPTKRATGREQAYEHFLDAHGRPTLRDASVVFWDVFGFKAISTLPPHESQEKLREVREAVQQARERAGTEEPAFLRCSSWFTDNVVLGTPIIGPQDLETTLGPTFVDVAYMQLILLRHGFLARGGMSFGKVYMDPTFVFGPALIEAHTIQEDADGPALPCVTVSIEVAQYCSALARGFYATPETSPFASELAVDGDTRTVFVDHLGIWIDEEDDIRVLEHALPWYKQTIRRQLRELPSGRARNKWRWLADYHDWALRSRGWNRREYVTGLGAQHSFTSFGDVLRAATP